MTMTSLAIDANRPWPQRAAAELFTSLLAALRLHQPYLLIIAVYLIACLVAGRLSGGDVVVNIRIVNQLVPTLIVIAALAAFFLHFMWMCCIVRPKGSLFAAIGVDLWNRILTPRKLFSVLIVIGTTPLFFSIFSSFKRMIPFLHPFSWDTTFMEWDLALHGGRHPWEWLQPILGQPALTEVINGAYNFWLLIMFGTLIWQAGCGKRLELRMQYLYANMLTWIILGTVMAVGLASVGPCFYGNFHAPDPYAPLMDYLNAAQAEGYSIWALNIQHGLWESYLNRGTEIGRGISAMPSLHVATAVLMALLGWRTHRLLGIAYTIFAVLIMLGSVHLGWHYAIDGYVSTVAVLAIWYGVGWAVRRSRTVSEFRQDRGRDMSASADTCRDRLLNSAASEALNRREA